MRNKCNCYEDGKCFGTKEKDMCTCEGDRLKCDFYSEVRREARLMDEGKVTAENAIELVWEYCDRYFKEREIKDFENFAEIVDMRNRNVYLGDVVEDTGSAIESIIRLHNQYDTQKNIPIEEREPIKLWISSNGGDLDSAFTICDAIALSETPVYTINQGKAYSAGALIFLCGDKRFTFPSSSFLLHEGSIGAGVVDAHKFQNLSDFYASQRAQLKKLVLSHSNIEEALYDSHAKDDWWLNVDEACELGLVDVVMDSSSYSDLLK